MPHRGPVPLVKQSQRSAMTRHILVGALGEPRMRELRAQGEAMDEDQICTFARRHIDEFLTSHTDQL
jgi:hypothetical protein